MSGSSRGYNPDLDERVFQRLVDELGEEQARKILGGPPAARRSSGHVPEVVGVKAKRAPAITRTRGGQSWRDLKDHDFVFGQTVARSWTCRNDRRDPCSACGQPIRRDQEAARLRPSGKLIHFQQGCVPDRI